MNSELRRLIHKLYAIQLKLELLSATDDLDDFKTQLEQQVQELNNTIRELHSSLDLVEYTISKYEGTVL